MQEDGVVPLRGGDYDRWDIEARGGLLGSARLRHTVEEHGGGRQLVRYRIWPRPSRFGLGVSLMLGTLSALARHDGAYPAAAVLTLVAVAGLALLLAECGCACGAIVEAASADHLPPEPQDELTRESSEPKLEVV